METATAEIAKDFGVRGGIFAKWLCQPGIDVGKMPGSH